MPETAQVYRGEVLHSAWNETTAECTMRVLPHSVRGECETGVVEMPLEDLQVEYQGGKFPRLLFTRERIERMKKKWEQSPRKSGFVVLKKIEWHQPENKGLELLKHLHETRKSK